MERAIKAKFNKGLIRPLEELELEEGQEILVTIKDLPQEDRFDRAAGGWRGLIDCQRLITDIYSDRLLRTRPEPRL